MSISRRLLHYICLRGPAGVERHFLEFTNAVANRDDAWRQMLLATGGSVHRFISDALNHSVEQKHEKQLGPVKLPRYPRLLRSLHRRKVINRFDPQLTLIWNRPSRCSELLKNIGDRQWLYWEHGEAWHHTHVDIKQAFYHRAPFVIANSHAAMRVMQLQWNLQAPVEVCLNALRPSLRSVKVAARTLPSGRRFRIGTVSRLVPLKGGPLVLHTLYELQRRGMDVELHIAGEGGLKTVLDTLAKKLGLVDRLFWHGLVQNMAEFYREVDCLLHPAIHEPFGLIGIEAAAFGCPVIASAVDGLPEAVRNGETGYCLRPELGLSRYREFGGSEEGVPPYVYDPLQDSMMEPRFVEPARLAECIISVLSNPERYEELSRGGIAAIDRYFDFAQHVDKVLGVCSSLIERKA